MAARYGHTVVAVDLSAVGVAQLQEDAQAERLDITATVGDATTFSSRRKFDVVIVDRVLHMLPDPAQRERCLDRAAGFVRSGGFILTADTPTNKTLIRTYFAERPDRWTVTKQTKGFVFARRRPAS